MSRFLRASPLRRALAILPALLGSSANAQTPATRPDSTDAVLIAAAESHGAKFTRLAPPNKPGRNFRDTVDGTAERRCVAGRGVGPVRSGEFIIGGALEGWFSASGSSLTRKIWWAPLHSERVMPFLLVSGRKLGAESDTLTFSSGQIARGRGAADNEYFFPSAFTLPRAGRWLLIASSGPNWGCFILTVR